MSTPQQPEHRPGPASTRGPHPDRPDAPEHVPPGFVHVWESAWEAGYDAGRAQAMSPDPRPLVAAASGSRVYPGGEPQEAELDWRRRVHAQVRAQDPRLHVRWTRQPYTGHFLSNHDLFTVRWFAEGPTSDPVSDHTAEV